MRILVTGATGVLGREAVPRLVAAGHEVTGVARSQEGLRWLDATGARPIEVDLLDPADVRGAVRGAEGIVHLATALPPLSRSTRRKEWVLNDRLRTEAVASLVDAGHAEGIRVLIQPTVTLVYADGGADWLDEDSPVEPPFFALESALVAEAETQRFTESGGTGIVLRLSRLYGPGRASAELVAMLRRGRGIVVGDGSNFVSSLHAADAGRAIAAALHVPAGIYNVTDDRPLTSLELTAAMARAVGAPEPRRIPVWVGRLIMGQAVRLMTVSQRVSNRRFREVAGWAPAHPGALDGVATLH